ncbi:hypothetical protein [Dermatobacter hominis]|uniref:hypothetical protein n=1 Tax=Dermatobacter hominis TaxID=2884263 RepID=UPI001D113FE8|nr:hypothetical protein [Dermatobacter hominis]UDY36533.1 hypothetical protein LH044_03105 [Dermatobacter hominis]
MSSVVMIHGAFHELWGPFRLWTRWTPSVLDGLWVAGVSMRDVSLPRLQDASVVAFWGDLVRPEPRTPDQLAAETTAGEPPDAVADLVEGVGSTQGPGGTDLDALVHQVAKDTNARSMELLAQYVLDPDVRAKVHERLERHLTPDTRVVVAHSLGTVIAYQVLCTRPDLEVDLITLGSPLGDPNMVFPLLQPAPVDGKGVWPAAVKRWTNVAAEGDLATAACPRLAEAFGDRVEDHLVFNGRHAHNAEPYLNSVPTGAALADALGLERRC